MKNSTVSKVMTTTALVLLTLLPIATRADTAFNQQQLLVTPLDVPRENVTAIRNARVKEGRSVSEVKTPMGDIGRVIAAFAESTDDVEQRQYMQQALDAVDAMKASIAKAQEKNASSYKAIRNAVLASSLAEQNPKAAADIVNQNLYANARNVFAVQGPPKGMGAYSTVLYAQKLRSDLAAKFDHDFNITGSISSVGELVDNLTQTHATYAYLKAMDDVALMFTNALHQLADEKANGEQIIGPIGNSREQLDEIFEAGEAIAEELNTVKGNKNSETTSSDFEDWNYF